MRCLFEIGVGRREGEKGRRGKREKGRRGGEKRRRDKVRRERREKGRRGGFGSSHPQDLNTVLVTDGDPVRLGG